MRNLNRSIFRYNHFNNGVMLLAFVVGFGLQIAVTEIAFVTEIFGTVAIIERVAHLNSLIYSSTVVP